MYSIKNINAMITASYCISMINIEIVNLLIVLSRSILFLKD